MPERDSTGQLLNISLKSNTLASLLTEFDKERDHKYPYITYCLYVNTNKDDNGMKPLQSFINLMYKFCTSLK
jgi:hypothetical protein